MTRVGNIMAVIFAYTSVILIISMILGPSNPITDRIAIVDEVTTILGGGQTLTSQAELTASSEGVPFVEEVEVNDVNLSLSDQLWRFTTGLLSGALQNVLPDEVKSALLFAAKFFGMMWAILSLLWKLATNGVALLAIGLAQNSITDVILGIFLLPMTLTVIRAIIEGMAYVLEHIPVVGRGGGEG